MNARLRREATVQDLRDGRRPGRAGAHRSAKDYRRKPKYPPSHEED